MDQINPEILTKIDRTDNLPQKVKDFLKEILEAESSTVDKGSKIEAHNKIVNRYYNDPEVLEWAKRGAQGP